MTSSKYLDSLGVSYLWNKVKRYVTDHTYSRVTDGSNEIVADDNTHTIQIGGSGVITVALAEDGTSHNAKFTISTTAEVNQNAFSNVKVGSTTIAADSKTDTVEFAVGTGANGGLTIEGDASNDKVTIKGKSETAASGGTTLSMVTTGEKYTWNQAEVNQNAFSNVKVGSTTVAADSKTDTLELVGSNVTLTPDGTNDKVTIGITATNVTTALGNTPVARATADASGNAITTTYAPLASPALTGTPTAPTAAAGTNTTQIATTAFVQSAISSSNAIVVLISAMSANSVTFADYTSALFLALCADSIIDRIYLRYGADGADISGSDGIVYFPVYDSLVSADNPYYHRTLGWSTFYKNTNGSITHKFIQVNIPSEDLSYATYSTYDVSDVLNTTGSTADASKLFIVGAKTQAANPQTYSLDKAYITAGKVYSNAKEVVNLSDTQALTNKTYNGYTLAAACAKSVDTSITSGSTSTNVPTTAAVEARIASAIQAAQSGAAMYQGAAPTEFAPTNYKSGYYWIVRTAGTYVGQPCEAGDMIFANADGATYSASNFDVIQTNLDIASMTNSEIDAATDQTPNPS